MPYFINPVEQDQCVCLTYAGELPWSEVAAARQQTAELLAAKRWKRALVDVTALQTVPKAGELFQLGQDVVKVAPRGARIALVIRPDQVKRAKLLEKIVRSDGAFLTFFTAPEKAQAWVRQGVLQARVKLTGVGA